MGTSDVTRLIADLEGGSTEVFDELIDRVYPDLREIAHAKLRRQRAGHTLHTVDLVHEAYLRLVRYQDVSWKGRAHFFGAAAQAMRRVLIDYARFKNARKRKGEHVTLSEARGSEALSLEELIELDDALSRLAEQHPRWARVVECRYFTGLTIEETAEALRISHGTVSNDWRMARAWLRRAMYDGENDVPST